MSLSNFIAIPAIDSDVFNPDSVLSLTRKYLDDNEDALLLASELLHLIEDDMLSHDEKLKEIDAIISDFDSSLVLEFFNEQNLARYFIELLENTGKSISEAKDILVNSFPIFNLIDSDKDILSDRIDRFTIPCMNSVYPLYCEPDEAAIRHFLEVCPDVAFYEIGDSNYFIYMTSGGKVLSSHLAYAYLYVDGSIPNNLASSSHDFSDLNPVACKMIVDFFSDLDKSKNTACNKNKTTLLFSRNSLEGIENYAVVNISSTQSKDPSVLIKKLKTAISNWILSFDEGKLAWEYSSSDFNIGDFSSYESDENLQKMIEEEGIEVSIESMSNIDSSFSYDLVLVNDDLFD